MSLTVQELQEWLNKYYPGSHQFPRELKYWVNKYHAETLEAKRLSHQRFKDFIRKVRTVFK